MKARALCCSALYISLCGSSAHSTDNVAVVYGNGVRNTWQDAEYSRDILEDVVRSDSRFSGLNITYDLVYNQTDCKPGNALGPDLGCVGDLFEAFLQLTPGAKPKQFWLFMGDDPAGAVADYEAFQETAGAVTNPLPPLPQLTVDIAEHLSLYKEQIQKGKRVVLVAHSQGNLFGNQAYQFLSVNEVKSFGMVSVATPADNVLGDKSFSAPYTTLGEDAIRKWYIPFETLPWNVTNGGPVDDPSWLFHGFVESYLVGFKSKSKILDDLLKVVESLSDPVLLLPGFTRISDMTFPRVFPCAVALSDGRVLVAGGFAPNRVPLNTAELYNPSTRTFTPTGTMTIPRGRGVICTRLDDDRVLIAGGEVSPFVYTAAAEVYDPTTGTFTPVGNMTTPRGEGWHAVAVPGGALLFGGTFEGGLGTASAAVDRFDAADETFSRVALLLGARRDYTMEHLSDGSVLLMGGVRSFNQNVSPIVERYGTSTNVSLQTGQPSGTPRTRSWGSALLPGGSVLLLSGVGLPAEVFNPSTNSFSLVPGSPSFHAGDFGKAAPLADGRVLVMGYGRSPGSVGRIAEMFDPVTASFTSLGSFAVPGPCEGYVATPLQDGTVLITGGGVPPSCDSMPLAEIFNPNGL